MRFCLSTFFGFVLLLVIIPVLKLRAETPPPITIVATENNSPFSFSLPDGTATGLYVEIWELWSKTNNIPINVVMMSFEESVQAVKNKQAVHAGLFINDSRKQWAEFSLPIHSVETGILYSRNYPKTLRLKDAMGIKVSTQAASFQAEFLVRTFPSVELSYYTDSEDVINQLLNDEIEAIVAEVPYLEALQAKHGLHGVFTLADERLLINEVHAVMAKGQPELIKIINQGIENIPIKALTDLEKKWLPTFKPFFKDVVSFNALTIAEKKWLQRNSSFRLGVDTAWYPFDFTNDDGLYSGIAADYVKYANELLNTNIEPVTGYTWLEAFNALKSGDLDVMSAAVSTEGRLKSMNFTDPYFVVPTVYVTRKNSFYAETMDSLNNRKLGLVKGVAIIELIKKEYPQIEIYLVDTIIEGLDKLQAGEIDAYIDGIAVINHEIDKRQITDLMVSAFTPYKLEISMAVRKGLEPLVTILNKTFANMDEKHKAAIANNWLAVHVQNGTNMNTILAWGVPTASLFILTIFMITKFNRSLKSEIAIRKEAEKELKHLAQHDALTGLPNWRLFEELSDLSLNQAKRNKNEQAVLFMDIDGFKSVNDSFGHKAGDQLLIMIAERIRESVRESDIVARIGGDEFTVHLSEECGAKAASAIALKIIRAISIPFELKEGTVNVGVSVGISIYPDDGETVEELSRNADSAMYSVKKSGKNAFKLFNFHLG